MPELPIRDSLTVSADVILFGEYPQLLHNNNLFDLFHLYLSDLLPFFS